MSHRSPATSLCIAGLLAVAGCRASQHPAPPPPPPLHPGAAAHAPAVPAAGPRAWEEPEAGEVEADSRRVFEVKDDLGNDYRLMLAPHPFRKDEIGKGLWKRSNYGWVFELRTGFVYLEGRFRGDKLGPAGGGTGPLGLLGNSGHSQRVIGVRLPWHIVERGALSAGAFGTVFVVEADGTVTRAYLLDPDVKNDTIGHDDHRLSIENDGRPYRDDMIDEKYEGYYLHQPLDVGAVAPWAGQGKHAPPIQVDGGQGPYPDRRAFVDAVKKTACEAGLRTWATTR